MNKFFHRRTAPQFALSIIALTLAAVSSSASAAAPAAGSVYVLSNQAAGNAVLVYDRSANGTLTFEGSVATGGTGTITPPPPTGAPGIDPLGSQGAVVYSDGLLLAVNAGSNDISLFQANAQGLKLLDRVPSGGVLPTSIAVRGDLVYVLNAGGTPGISGFRLDLLRRHLIALPNDIVPLPGGATAGPGQIGITPDGSYVVVTEKTTNLIDTFSLGGNGRATLAASSASVGATPFGFTTSSNGTLVVVDTGSGAASSYQLLPNGTYEPISGAVSLDGQTAPCWLATTPDGEWAFTGNAGTASISSLKVSTTGTLTLQTAVDASTPGAALDLGLSADGNFLFVRSANGAVSGAPESVNSFKVGHDGSLTAVSSIANLPAGAQGIAVR